MKKITLTLLAALCCMASMKAQTYDLNTYKYRFQRLRSLYLNYDMSVNSSTSANKALNTPGIVQSETHINNTYGAAGVSLVYAKTINTERLQQNEFMTLNGSYNGSLFSSKTNNSGIASESRIGQQQLAAYLNYSNSMRYYKGPRFFEINYGISSDINYNSYKDTAMLSYDNTNVRSYSPMANLSAGIGKGRLEYVTDAVSAMFMLQDLQRKAGIGQYSNEQIEAVAKGITAIRNTRFIDFRFRLIDQLTLLDSVFKANGITSGLPVKYFTTLSDNWLYATNFQRYSGGRFTMSVTSNGGAGSNSYRYGYYGYSNRYSRNADERNIQNGINISYTRSKQLGLHAERQYGFSLGSRLSHSTRTYENKDSGAYYSYNKIKEDMMNFYINTNIRYLYQPDTRTYLIAKLDLSAVRYDNLYGLRQSNPSEAKRYMLNFALVPNVEVFRFFSPRLTMFANLGISLNKTVDRYTSESAGTGYKYNSDGKSAGVNFNSGIRYVFF